MDKKDLSKNLLENLIVPLPSYEEQDKIVKILLDIDRKINLSKVRKRRYEKIKQGLMDDLLTGKKRVKI